VRFNLTIAAKLAIAYGLFLAPIAYLGYQMVADKEANIGFAQKEIVGVDYIAEVRAVQDAVVRGAVMAGLAEPIKANEAARGGDLKTGPASDALLKALAGTDRPAAAQAGADLISKAADGSNLTLDPDLDSFYTQDALTVKVPTAVAGVAGLAAAVASTSRQVGASLGVAIAGAIVSASLGADTIAGAGFPAATHAVWWIVLGSGLAVGVLGWLANTRRAQTSARLTAGMMETAV